MELKGFSVCLICDLLTRAGASSQASLLSHSILPHSHRKCARVINLQRPVCSSDVITDEVLNHLIPQRTRPVASVLRVQSGSSPSVRPWTTNSSELVCSSPSPNPQVGHTTGGFLQHISDLEVGSDQIHPFSLCSPSDPDQTKAPCMFSRSLNLISRTFQICHRGLTKI